MESFRTPYEKIIVPGWAPSPCQKQFCFVLRLGLECRTATLYVNHATLVFADQTAGINLAIKFLEVIPCSTHFMLETTVPRLVALGLF